MVRLERDVGAKPDLEQSDVVQTTDRDGLGRKKRK